MLRKKQIVPNREYEWVRHLIKKYNLEKDPTKKEEIMDKIEKAKAEINRRKMLESCL